MKKVKHLLSTPSSLIFFALIAYEFKMMLLLFNKYWFFVSRFFYYFALKLRKLEKEWIKWEIFSLFFEGMEKFNTTTIISNPWISSIKIDIQSHERKFSFSEKFWKRWSSRRKKEGKTFLIYIFFIFIYKKKQRKSFHFISFFLWVFKLFKFYAFKSCILAKIVFPLFENWKS